MSRNKVEHLSLSSIGRFPEAWQSVTLSDICHQVTDGTHDSPKESPDGFPLVTGKAIKNRRIDFDITYRISDADHAKVISRSKPERDDILFANIGNSIGDLVRVDTDREFSIKNVALFKPDKAKVEPRYLEYFLFSQSVQAFIKNTTKGSAQPFIGLSSLRGFPVALPTLEDQRYIVKVLGDLDDKIELNRQMNETLEAMAQALFKSWFVDFDPVIDNALAAGNEIPEPLQLRATARQALGDQRKPLPPEIQTQFPNSFVFTDELGWIPEGWEVRCILDVCDLQGGTQPPASTFVDKPAEGYVRLLQIRDFTNDNHVTYVPDTKKLRHVTEDEILIGRYGSASGDRKSDSLGRICRGKAGVYNVALMKLVPILAGTEFSLRLYDSDAFYDYLYGVSNKAVQSGFSKKELTGCCVCLPSPELIGEYERYGLHIWKKKKSIGIQNQNLGLLRDTLLPKLLSGELRVTDVEQQVTEAL